MSFAAVDARLGEMHGYRTAAAQNAPLVGMVDMGPNPIHFPKPETSVRKSDVVEIQQHLERIEQKLDALEAKTEERFRVFAHVLAAGDDRLEAKLQIIQTALKSGAIGAWGNER